MSRSNIVIVPGWNGSGPDHWQTIWERDHPEYVRVAHLDWRSVHRPDWVRALDRTVLSLCGDVVLVAHSLGCLAVAWWASSRADSARRVQGAMLVAPPDLGSASGAWRRSPVSRQFLWCGFHSLRCWSRAKTTRIPASRRAPAWPANGQASS